MTPNFRAHFVPKEETDRTCVFAPASLHAWLLKASRKCARLGRRELLKSLPIKPKLEKEAMTYQVLRPKDPYSGPQHPCKNPSTCDSVGPWLPEQASLNGALHKSCEERYRMHIILASLRGGLIRLCCFWGGGGGRGLGGLARASMKGLELGVFATKESTT